MSPPQSGGRHIAFGLVPLGVGVIVGVGVGVGVPSFPNHHWKTEFFHDTLHTHYSSGAVAPLSIFNFFLKKFRFPWQQVGLSLNLE